MVMSVKPRLNVCIVVLWRSVVSVVTAELQRCDCVREYEIVWVTCRAGAEAEAEAGCQPR